MRNRIFIFLITLIVGTITINGCVHEPFAPPPIPEPPVVVNPGNTGGYVGTPCVYQGVCFESVILPIYVSSCARSKCHDVKTRKADRILDSYANILKGGITPGNHTSSKLYKVLFATESDQMPPLPDTQLSKAQKDSIAKWIDQGAKNTVKCNCSCDTTQFKYATIVQPLIQNYCVGCHNPNSLGGNVDLSTYTLTKSAATSGKLVGSVKQQATFSPMPKNGKLSDCQIIQISKWVQAGSLNN
jgi:Planctomycete cytochrome C